MFFNDMENRPLISVLIPCYNASKYIGECIDSVLSQSYSNFEMIIVDDGSTDNTLEIIKSYQDNRIKVFEKEHSGLVNTLNYGFKQCNGEYIARLDSDDIMYSARLEHQLNYMLNHDYVDILGGGMECANEEDWVNHKPTHLVMHEEAIVTLDLLKDSNKISHPTVFMKKKSLEDLPFLYEGYYESGEDYKLWVTALLHGKTIVVEPTIVTRYRLHDGQINKRNAKKQYETTVKVINLIKNLNNKNKRLTCIITFKNEGCEVEKTVASILATSSSARIILINDGSDDGYDYKSLSKIYFCEYYENKESIGVANSRDLGVSLTKTEYFVLLDAHMRFFTFGWDLKLIDILDGNPKSLVTTNSVEIRKNGDTYWNEEGKDLRPVGGGNGAFLHFVGGQMYLPIFNGNTPMDTTDNPIIISTVFGAVYASSVEFWTHIGGLHGLISWGYDETLMSIKTWLSGGKCILLRDVFVGHIYRSIGNYTINNRDVLSNQLYIMNLFDDEETIKEYENRMISEYGEYEFEEVKKIFEKRKYDCIGFRKYFEENVLEHTFEEFKSLNNYIATTNNTSVPNNNTICVVGDDEEMTSVKKFLDSGYKVLFFTRCMTEKQNDKFAFELKNLFLQVFSIEEKFETTFEKNTTPFFILDKYGNEERKLDELNDLTVKPYHVLTSGKPNFDFTSFVPNVDIFDMPNYYDNETFINKEEFAEENGNVLYKI